MGGRDHAVECERHPGTWYSGFDGPDDCPRCEAERPRKRRRLRCRLGIHGPYDRIRMQPTKGGERIWCGDCGATWDSTYDGVYPAGWRRRRDLSFGGPLSTPHEVTIPEGLTWTCHVCGEERPDALIEVHSETVTIPGRTTIALTTNVRFCADRLGCRADAPKIAKRWQRPAMGPPV